MAKAGVFKISTGNTVQKWYVFFRVEEKSPLLRKDKRKIPYFLVANWYIEKVIQKCSQECIRTLLQDMMHMYTHGTLIPKMLEVIFTGTTKAKLLENYGLMTLFQETVGEWLIKLVFKYDYAANNYYVGVHKKKDMIWYIWKFIDCYPLLERCMIRWIHMTAEESEHYKGYKMKRLLQDQAAVARYATPMVTPMMLLIYNSIMLTCYHSFKILLTKVARKEILEVG